MGSVSLKLVALEYMLWCDVNKQMETLYSMEMDEV